MKRSIVILALAVVLAAVPLGFVAADNPCPDQPVHTYGFVLATGLPPLAVSLGSSTVTVGDTNVSECDGDPRTPLDFDGDYDTGLGGAFFGYGAWAEDPDCGYRHNVHGPNVAVSDVVFGSSVSFVVAENDQSGPVKLSDPATGNTLCETDGVIQPLDPSMRAAFGDADDCVSSPFQGNGATCGTGGGDGGYWVFLCCVVRIKCNPAGCRAVVMCDERWPENILMNPATEGIITSY